MKKMKIVSGLMAMAMAATSIGISAFAATDVAVKIGTVKANAGETFKVDVDLSSLPTGGLTSVDFAIGYDSSVLKDISVTAGTAKNGAADQEGEVGDTLFTWKDTGKQIILVWATGLTDSKYWLQEGTFVTISGTVADGAKEGEYVLKPEAVSREAYPGGSANDAMVFAQVGESNTEDCTASFTNGAVNVGGGTVETTKANNGGGGDSDLKLGDANCDKKITVGDAVLLARVAAEDSSAKITDQGKANGDVVADGTITTDDVTLILKYLAGLAKDTDFGK